MFRAGELVRWMEPIDEDYSYGTIVGINGSYARIRGLGYYHGTFLEVYVGYIRKVQGGDCYGGSKKSGKRTSLKVKL
jgi:hypothetical protein